MRNRLGRVVHERPTGKHNADLLPARGWDECRYGVLGTRYVKQTSDVSSVRNDPALPATQRSTGSQTEKAIADRKSQLIDRFAKRIEALRGKHPSGIRGRFEQAFHFPQSSDVATVEAKYCAFRDRFSAPLKSRYLSRR